MTVINAIKQATIKSLNFSLNIVEGVTNPSNKPEDVGVRRTYPSYQSVRVMEKVEDGAKVDESIEDYRKNVEKPVLDRVEETNASFRRSPTNTAYTLNGKDYGILQAGCCIEIEAEPAVLYVEDMKARSEKDYKQLCIESYYNDEKKGAGLTLSNYLLAKTNKAEQDKKDAMKKAVNATFSAMIHPNLSKGQSLNATLEKLAEQAEVEGKEMAVVVMEWIIKNPKR